MVWYEEIRLLIFKQRLTACKFGESYFKYFGIENNGGGAKKGENPKFYIVKETTEGIKG